MVVGALVAVCGVVLVLARLPSRTSWDSPDVTVTASAAAER